MPKLIRNTIISALILLACVLAVIPPSEKLKLGRDLAGGATLTYQVDLAPTDPPEVVDNIIEVLKERINPAGVLEISFTRIGRDQLEIAMPLPNERVQELKRAYLEELTKIDRLDLDPASFELAYRAYDAGDDKAFEPLMDTEARRALIQPVIEAHRAAREARVALAAGEATAASPEEIDRLETAAAEADLKLEAARDRAERGHITSEEVRAAMELSDEAHRILDAQTSRFIEEPSPRARAIEALRLRVRDLPGGAEALDAVVAAHKNYSENRKGLDDPQDLKRLLRGAGVLNFRIAPAPGELLEEARLRKELRERGIGGVRSDVAAWFPVNKIEHWYEDTAGFYQLFGKRAADAEGKPTDQWEIEPNPAGYFATRYKLVGEESGGIFYILLYDTPELRLTEAEGQWRVSGAGRGMDELGRPAVDFAMDPRGADLLGRLTESNLGKNMAVVLDDQVFTAPNLEGRISTRGTIFGKFEEPELQYLIRTLAAGSLQAKLSEKPISETVVAPELGADNLRRGLQACYISFSLVGAFMVCYYFLPGVVAIFGMFATGLIVTGAMALQGASFTLPGIAGIALTFGMAVDSNVLIYERLREEIAAGNTLKNALRQSYKRAGSAIIDANVTTLLTCFILYYVGTTEIKGFAVSLGIGVVGTMIMILLMTRVVLYWLIDRANIQAMRFQLPLVIPAIQRILTPRVQWLKYRHVFYTLSVLAVIASITLIAVQGAKMLDSEFRGGTAVTLDLKQTDAQGRPTGEPRKMTRAEVEERIIKAAEATTDDPEMLDLRNAEVIPVNPDRDGVTSSRFTIKSTVTNQDRMRDAIVSQFQDSVPAQPALEFVGSDQADHAGAATAYKILAPTLGEVIPSLSGVRFDVSRFEGGVAILLDDIRAEATRPTLDSLRERLAYQRLQPDFSQAVRREADVVLLRGTPEAVEAAALIVRDPAISAYDEAKWSADLAQVEWNLARTALTQASRLAGVQAFDPAIATTFRNQAIVAALISFFAITIYVWWRFGSYRYAVAAILPLLHDCVIVVGLIALAEVLYDKFPVVANFGLKPYKIDMGLVAAIMTIIGYSLNDTIVVLDRIRENRGKLAYASAEVINKSINQTMSRTVITGGGVIVSLIILLLLGGQAIASFAYALLAGVIVGTYSSFTISAPMVYDKTIPPASARPDATPDVPTPAGALGSSLATT